ncbi:hypothetical protein JN531_016725 (plasmid) [Flagellatimonas centrodinii]|uniref:hypothetical protein n=1 Tax=Flagellatimonas centrodinii TaxID=2806210 RepID=UPI001FFC3981|nr:hypothetical protein [Flagellatimonas centrodinii]ULQ48422.1 hypothetical protein JN531_016725 [Flagellatimonas centrodinii]
MHPHPIRHPTHPAAAELLTHQDSAVVVPTDALAFLISESDIDPNAGLGAFMPLDGPAYYALPDLPEMLPFLRSTAAAGIPGSLEGYYLTPHRTGGGEYWDITLVYRHRSHDQAQSVPIQLGPLHCNQPAAQQIEAALLSIDPGLRLTLRPLLDFSLILWGYLSGDPEIQVHPQSIIPPGRFTVPTMPAAVPVMEAGPRDVTTVLGGRMLAIQPVARWRRGLVTAPPRPGTTTVSVWTLPTLERVGPTDRHPE